MDVCRKICVDRGEGNEKHENVEKSENVFVFKQGIWLRVLGKEKEDRKNIVQLIMLRVDENHMYICIKPVI